MEIVTSLKNMLQSLYHNRIPILLTVSCVLLTLVFLVYFYRPPGADIGPEQPIAFSHRVHAGVKEIQCRFCHPYVTRSGFPGMPSVEKCLFCHKYIIAEHPEIKKEHDYFNTKTPTPWVKVNYIPEHVFFKHQPHIRQKIDCQECHGPVETMDRLKDAEFEMGFCISCHQEKKAQLGCWLACHN